MLPTVADNERPSGPLKMPTLTYTVFKLNYSFHLASSGSLSTDSNRRNCIETAVPPHFNFTTAHHYHSLPLLFLFHHQDCVATRTRRLIRKTRMPFAVITADLLLRLMYRAKP